MERFSRLAGKIQRKRRSDVEEEERVWEVPGGMGMVSTAVGSRCTLGSWFSSSSQRRRKTRIERYPGIVHRLREWGYATQVTGIGWVCSNPVEEWDGLEWEALGMIW